MARTIRAVIFDLDGVITDTAVSHYKAWKRLADEEGIPFSQEDGDELRGVSRRPALERIIGDRPYTEDQILEMMDRKNNYYVASLDDITHDDLLPGAEALIGELRGAGIKVAIGSASKNARPVLQRLDIIDLFESISDGDSVDEHKPDPALFLHAAEQLGVDPSEAVVVEDAEAGVQAALAGKFMTVGLGPHDRVGSAEVVYPSLDGVTLADLLSRLDGQAPSSA